MTERPATPAKPHWNEEIPGLWTGLVRIDEMDRHTLRYIRGLPGVYRLVALCDSEKKIPMRIARLSGIDLTGTLYIGKESVNMRDRSRLSKLVRSLNYTVWPRLPRYKKEHDAGYRLRSHSILNAQFTPDKLAVEWSYEDDAMGADNAERELLGFYFRCFGDTPPLTFRMRGN